MKKLVSLALVLVLCISLMSGVLVSAAEGTITKVTDGNLTSGQYVMIANNGYAPTVYDNKWMLSSVPTVEGDNVTDAKGAIVTLTVDGSKVVITDSNGKAVTYKGGKNELQEGDAAWNWKYADGTFTFDDGVTDVNDKGEAQTRYLCSAGKNDNKFRAYRNPSAEADSYGNTYFHLFTLYKVEGEVDPGTPNVPETPEEPEGFDPTGKTPAEIMAAAYALVDGQKMLAPCTLTGKVTAIDTPYNEQFGNVTVIISVEDKDLMCYRLKGDEAADVVVGDTITVTGTIKNYKGTIEFDTGCTLDKREPVVVDPVPPTGDTTPVFLLVALMTVSMAGIILTKKSYC